MRLGARRTVSWMSCVLVVTMVLAIAPEPARAQQPPHLRVADRTLSELLKRGASLSPTLQQLLVRTEAASVFVFVECSQKLASRVGASLTLLTSVRGMRYVGVKVDCRLTAREIVGLLSHELQHALEISARPDIVDVDAMEAFYEDVGFQVFQDGNHRFFETDEAIAVQQRVVREVSRSTAFMVP